MALSGFRLLLVGIALFVPCATFAQQYTVTDLGMRTAWAINGRGQAIGTSSVEGQTHAFIWTDGTLQDLGLPPGANSCVPRGINDRGEVVGTCFGYGTFLRQPFLWTAEYGITALPFLIGDYAYADATGINSDGHIVGWRGAGPDAFLYRHGRVEDLGRGAEAFGINDQDQVVGIGARGVVVWDDDGPHVIDGDRFSNGSAISEFGIVAGESLRGGPLRHAVLWTPYGVSDLGTLPEGTSSAAFAISGDLIVGGSYADPHWAHAFLYDNQGPGYAVDLNDLVPPDSDWLLSVAFGINAAGQIVGNGTVNGESRAFLLTPVPLTASPRY
jgi:probable HAF family extracellular repeat protein